MPFYHQFPTNLSTDPPDMLPISPIEPSMIPPFEPPKDASEMECQICGDVMWNPPLTSLSPSSSQTKAPLTPPASPIRSPAKTVVFQPEIPYKLPCSHVFGSRCIIRWLQISHRQDCPHCRRRMVHKGCGHLIMPHHAASAPPTIREEETPRDCVRCRGESEVSKIVARERALLEGRERVLRGNRFMPRFWAGINLGRGEIEMRDVEVRVEELRRGFVGVYERAWREYEDRERRDRW